MEGVVAELSLPQTWGKVGLWIRFILRSFQSSRGKAREFGDFQGP